LNNYSSLCVPIPEPHASRIVDYAKGLISDDDLRKLEFHPHVTIRYGIDTNKAENVVKALGSFIPVRVMFGKTSAFMTDNDQECDILKIDVFGASLERLRKKVEDNLETIPHPWKAYNPHLTLAYIDMGSSLMYMGNNPVIGEKIVVDKLLFIPAFGGKKKYITTEGKVEDYA